MHDKAILENAITLKCVRESYKNHEICNKAVGNYSHAIEYFSEFYKTQTMWDKAVYTFPSTLKFLPECCKAKEMCHRAVHTCFFVFDVTLDKHQTEENIT